MEYRNDDQLIAEAEKEMLRRFFDGGNCLAEKPSDCAHAVGKEVKAAYGAYYYSTLDHDPTSVNRKHVKNMGNIFISTAKVKADSKWIAAKMLLGV